MDVYNDLSDLMPEHNFGVVDVLTHEGELIKASFMLEITPWTYFVKTNDTQRTYYRFNGLESVTRLSQFLRNETKWESMEVKGHVPSVVGVFGLY